ncbi:MAG: HAMP domain-containing histidine kinase, partial [Candidatus Obscuribacterales bacterium]|nr:HAMP domain-containing histidine kinase [Candidatus Obscuribacterales bacterium]
SYRQFFCIAHDIDEAKKLRMMRQEFVNMVTHDVKTPLSAIKVFLDITTDTQIYGELTEKGKRTAQSLLASADRILQLLNNLLDLEKLETGMTHLDLKPVSFVDVISDCIAELEPLASLKNVSLDWRSEAKGIIAGDAEKLVQVVQNIMSNAIKYSPEHSAVTIEMDQVGGEIKCRIKDQGQGIDLEDQDSIFDRFTQARHGAKAKPGHGLGLSIARAIVEAHGGKIGVVSVPGDGAEFWFTLPLAEASVATTAT